MHPKLPSAIDHLLSDISLSEERFFSFCIENMKKKRKEGRKEKKKIHSQTPNLREYMHIVWEEQEYGFWKVIHTKM